MKIGPIVHSTLARSVAERLIRLIVDGTIKPSAKMPSERELMDKLKVARSTVREALQSLAAFNVVEIRPGIGTFVNPNAKELIPHALRALHDSKDAPSALAAPARAPAPSATCPRARLPTHR